MPANHDIDSTNLIPDPLHSDLAHIESSLPSPRHGRRHNLSTAHLVTTRCWIETARKNYPGI